ncbi:MAG: hypothetical protein GY696_31155 [Gammaproteobacteria bacterium]|nr:hypothetical protein [Gammaproteobacteria bacterium]
MSPYGPYRLISVIIIQLKLIMRMLAMLSVSKVVWDQLVSEEASAEFRRACSNLAGARKIEFDRCILPVEFIGNPQLITFVDGSTRAMCAIITSVGRFKKIFSKVFWSVPRPKWRQKQQRQCQ